MFDIQCNPYLFITVLLYYVYVSIINPNLDKRDSKHQICIVNCKSVEIQLNTDQHAPVVNVILLIIVLINSTKDLEIVHGYHFEIATGNKSDLVAVLLL